MKVVVDTSVWSLALRRNQIQEDLPQVLSLRELIADGRVALLGAIRQEVLSGVREIEQLTTAWNCPFWHPCDIQVRSLGAD